MRKEKALIELLKRLVELVAEEAAKNASFGEKLDALLQPLPEKGSKTKIPRPQAKDLPDVYKEWESRGETEFRLWLRDQPLPTLRALIRIQDLDSTRRTSKWKEPEKLADFIADNLRQRLSRGSSFIGRGSTGQ